jgi:hypothetical protein
LGPADCPPSANWAGVRLAGLLFGDVPRSLLEGLRVEVRVAPSHGEVRRSCVDAQLMRMDRPLTVSEDPIGDLRGGAQKSIEEGCLDTPLRKGSGV